MGSSTCGFFEVPLPFARPLRGIWSAVTVLILLTAFPVFGDTITVTNTNDSGPGSLRDAIASAASGDTIDFNVPLPATITVSSPLTIDSSETKFLTIIGPGATLLSISGADSVAVFIVQPLFGAGGPVTATISGLTIEHGSSLLGGCIFNAGNLTLINVVVTRCTVGTHFGGGIFNVRELTLIGSAISGNTAVRGGGIYNGGELRVTNSTISGNSTVPLEIAPGVGGGIYNIGGSVSLIKSTVSGNSASTFGGGIHHELFSLRVTDSTISGNSAVNGGGISNGAVLRVTNSTISGNSAVPVALVVNSGLGGGILNLTPNLFLTNATISGNSAHNGGGIYAPTATSRGGSLKNTIVANNPSEVGGNCDGPLPISNGFNLSDDSSCGLGLNSDMNDTSAGLDPDGLKNNGGPTQTVALLATSPGVDAIPLGACTDEVGTKVTTDQRSVLRSQGALCDIGAHELFASKFFDEAMLTFQLADSVQSLSLPTEERSALVVHLKGAADSMNRDDADTAINQLGAFINATNAKVYSGALTSQQGSELTTSAEGVIVSLSGPVFVFGQ